jgi:hypothetical protein
LPPFRGTVQVSADPIGLRLATAPAFVPTVAGRL